MSGQQLPISWPGQPQANGVPGAPGVPIPQGAPALVPPPPFFGTTPPAWTGGTAADATQYAAAGSVAPPPFDTTQQQQPTPATVTDELAKRKKKLIKDTEKEMRARWSTRAEWFNRWNAEFGFTLDGCADPTNHKCQRWFGPGSPLGVFDGLKLDNVGVANENIFHNAPDFDPEFIKLAWQLMGRPLGHRPNLIVQVRPANQTEQPFWQEYVEQHRDWNGYQTLQPYGIDFRVRFLSPRIDFEPPPPRVVDGGEGIGPIMVEVKESSARSGHCLLIWRSLVQAPPPAQIDG